jgi:mannose/fructose/N-acetylgalactosamine-specific phosphotransferase system component IID
VKEKVFKTHLRFINSNPTIIYIVVGVEDQDNEIVDFDDSHIQNLVNAYLETHLKFNMKMSLSQTYQKTR